MFELCLVRHAIAEDRDPERWPDDSGRPLTRAGRERMAAAAPGLRALFTPEVVVSSPYLRATQTAQLLVAAYRLEEMALSEQLTMTPSDNLFAYLAKLHVQRVVAVGHEPYLSQTVSLAIAGPTDRVAVTFKKGAAALITFDEQPAPGRGCLEWLIQPSALRALSRR